MLEHVYTRTQWLAYPEKSHTPMCGRQRYSTSKFCNIYCTSTLAERIPAQTGKSITVNAFNPCMMPGTGLARYYNIFARLGWKYLLNNLTLVKKDVRTVTDSGKALARLITDPLWVYFLIQQSGHIVEQHSFMKGTKRSFGDLFSNKEAK